MTEVNVMTANQLKKILDRTLPNLRWKCCDHCDSNCGIAHAHPCGNTDSYGYKNCVRGQEALS